MNWEDEAYLLSKRKFRENANIINVFSKKYGKTSGIVYGGNSRKIRNFLQLGNKIYIFHKTKNENKLGYFQAELLNPISPRYFNDKKRTCVLSCVVTLLNSLLPEYQMNRKIYDSLENFIINLENDLWIINYILWEINLIKELGYGLDFSKSKIENPSNPDLYDFEIDNKIYQIPYFVFDVSQIKKKGPISKTLIKKGLIFSRILFFNKFFLNNNISFPKPRIILENYF